MTSHAHLLPALIAPLLFWRVYQRVRRNIGRQVFRARRSGFVAVLMAVAILAIGVALAQQPRGLLSLAGGVLLGIAIGFAGLKLTRFEANDAGQFYTPNPYLGIALSLLLVGRLIYRFLVLRSADVLLTSSIPGRGQSALTFLLLGLTLGYYVSYSGGLIVGFKSHVRSAKTT